MGYVRKTKDVWVIKTNWGYGWEVESEYDPSDYENPRLSARQDAKEYQRAGALVLIEKRRIAV